jgi:hypothetical protein
MPERRRLSFKSLDDAIPEVEHLLKGHVVAGQWTLAQICNHLATTILMTARPAAEPGQPTPEQARIRAGFFAAERFPDGRQVPGPFVPKPGLDAAHEAQSLATAIERFRSATGPFPAHPIIGPLSHDEWLRFHTMHAEHHLGFAVPT